MNPPPPVSGPWVIVRSAPTIFGCPKAFGYVMHEILERRVGDQFECNVDNVPGKKVRFHYALIWECSTDLVNAPSGTVR